MNDSNNTEDIIKGTRNIIHCLNNKLQTLEYQKYIINRQIEWMRNNETKYEVSLINEELISNNINDIVSNYRILPPRETVLDEGRYLSVQFYLLDDGVRIYSPDICNIGCIDLYHDIFYINDHDFITECDRLNLNKETVSKVIKVKSKIMKYYFPQWEEQ